MHLHFSNRIALLTVFVAVGTCISCGIGTHPDWMFFCGFVGMFMFFCAHWQTYVSGTLRFGLWVHLLMNLSNLPVWKFTDRFSIGFRRVDVTEVQIAIIIMYMMSAFGGVGLWETTVQPCTFYTVSISQCKQLLHCVYNGSELLAV